MSPRYIANFRGRWYLVHTAGRLEIHTINESTGAVVARQPITAADALPHWLSPDDRAEAERILQQEKP